MKIGKITFYILCAIVVFVSCNKDDNNPDVIVVEERDRAEQQVIDKDSLMGYLETHYYNSSDFVGNLNLEKKQDRDFSQVISTIKEIIETQKFEGASAGLLNPNIIASDLGLADKKELSGSVENPLTLVIQEISGNTLGPSND